LRGLSSSGSALQIDHQEAVTHRRAGDLDKIRQVEIALERARRDTAMQIRPAVLAIYASANGQTVPLRDDLDVVLIEAGDPLTMR
jgi:hypothetical protein